MTLATRRTSLLKKRLLTTLIAVFALLAQPLMPLNVPAAFAATQPVGVTISPNPVTGTEYVQFTNNGGNSVDISGIHVTEMSGANVADYFTVNAGTVLNNGQSYKVCFTGCNQAVTQNNKINDNGDTLTFYADNTKTKQLTSITTNAANGNKAGTLTTGSFELDPVAVPSINSAYFVLDNTGFKVGFTAHHFQKVTSVTVDLQKSDGTSIVKNTGKSALFALVNGQANKEIRTSFNIPAATSDDEYWEYGNRVAWTAADKPEQAIIAINSEKPTIVSTYTVSDSSPDATFEALLPSMPVDSVAPGAPAITAPGARTWHKTSPIATIWTAVAGAATYQVAYAYDDGHGFEGSTCLGETIDGKNVYCRDTDSTSRNHTPGANEQGGVTVWVRAVNSFGVPGLWSNSVHYYYDQSVPKTDMIVPSGTVGSLFMVSGNATDNLALNHVYIQLVNRQNSQRYGGTTVYLSGTAESWSHEFNAAQLNLPEGDYAAHVSVVDNAGNSSSVGWSDNFTVDRTTGPTVNVDAAPAEGATVAGGTVTITGTVKSDDFAWYRFQLLDADKQGITDSIIGGSDPVDGGTIGIINLDSLPSGALAGRMLPNGTYYVRVWAQDLYGNSTGTKNAPYIAQFVVSRPTLTQEGQESVTTTGGGESVSSSTSDNGDDSNNVQSFTTPIFGFGLPSLGDNDASQNQNQNQNNNGDRDVLGDQDQEGTPLSDTGEVLGIMNHRLFGIGWYWYLVIFIALVGGWLLLAAAIRRSRGTDL